MRIFDAHCDVLYKMWFKRSLSFEDAVELHVTHSQLSQFGAKVQCFAIYIPEQVSEVDRFEVALEMVDIFFNRLIGSYPTLKHVKTRNDIQTLKEWEIGAMLTLEGCDAIGSSLTKLATLLRLGVCSVGLTWNYANAVADGVLEKRGAGISLLGEKVVQLNNEFRVWTDVSHLSEKGFWDVMDLAKYPIASHSNCYRLCPHPRNLTDDQITGLVKKDGMIGITFVPQFVKENGEANMTDILHHIDHICSLGGKDNVGFGSDFDGITETVIGLANYQGYEVFINLLLKYYSETLVKKFLYDNFFHHLPK